MATAARFMTLTASEDETLRELETSPVVNAKVRLRASIVRLSHHGWTAPKLARHFGRGLQTIHSDLSRFEQFGVAGLIDGKAPGNKPSVTPEITAFLQHKLEEDRVWNSSLLSEVVRGQFGVTLGREVIRLKLLELGYSWKRARYAPGKQADPGVVAEHRASLETLSWTKRHTARVRYPLSLGRMSSSLPGLSAKRGHWSSD
jgi:transposase